MELELPLLDSTRRKFLMFRNNDSLIEMLPPPEDEEWPSTKVSPSFAESKIGLGTFCYKVNDLYKWYILPITKIVFTTAL